jgi:hypothetical protein
MKMAMTMIMMMMMLPVKTRYQTTAPATTTAAASAAAVTGTVMWCRSLVAAPLGTPALMMMTPMMMMITMKVRWLLLQLLPLRRGSVAAAVVSVKEERTRR